MIFPPILHVGSPKIGKFWSKQGNKTQSSLYFAIDDEKYLEQYWCLRKYHLIREFLLLQTNLTPSKKSNSLKEKRQNKVFLCCQHKVGCLTWLASDKRLSRFSNSISPSCEQTFVLQILQTIGNFQIQLFSHEKKFQSF